MRVISSARFWVALMLCIILCLGLLLTLKYSTISKAEETHQTIPYELLYTKQNTVPISSSTHNEKKVVKGMIVTEASNYEDLLQIAEVIKNQYKNKEINEVIFSIHNKNNGKYDEDLPYEPIGKGIITVTYDSISLGKSNVILHK
ncbi:hypothetical protein D0U04_02395 [Bacillus clarus]|uniref:Group-specific protein n=1 Tax=Bacillus clarus TaxID=2338372 RepID=A0A090YUG8_9BACI|nr:hypothetical protein [Bacillus clarus]KFN01912.1 hypothetical protein DJ93_3925 [Bacillus clarus]RFT68321.1 hypothetical protein D0U04_02395 [Bacillus clarus]